MAKKKPAKKNLTKKKTANKAPTKKKPTKKLGKKLGEKIAKKAVKAVAPQTMKKSKKPAKKETATRSNEVLKLAFTPLEDRILVARLGASDKTPGGIYIPDTAKERPSKGRVLAVGGGKYDKKGRRGVLDVKVGDVVLFTQWSGSELEVNKEKLLIMRESDILGIVAE